MENVLTVENVCKSYGSTLALNGLSFSVAGNRIVGLLGPNGSGKTTIVKLINTLITDYSGEIRVLGHKPGVESKKLVSYLPDRPSLREDLKIRTAVDMMADFYEDFDRPKAMEMLAAMSLSPTARIRTLSKGMKEKLQLTLTMSRRARLYICDEPIAGVDPAARDVILETILRNFVENASLLITTHLIGDVENILDRVLFIKEGQIILDEDADELREREGKSVDMIFREVFKCSGN